MNRSAVRAGRKVGGALVGLVALAAIVMPASPASAATTFGEFITLPAGVAAGFDISGVAILTRTGHTSARIVVTGLTPGVTYAAHVHNDVCSAANPAGGHYQDTAGAGAQPPNELWLSSTRDPFAGVTANLGGVAVGRGSASWVARPEAKAIVIHMIPPGGNTGGGPKIACADLA